MLCSFILLKKIEYFIENLKRRKVWNKKEQKYFAFASLRLANTGSFFCFYWNYIYSFILLINIHREHTICQILSFEKNQCYWPISRIVLVQQKYIQTIITFSNNQINFPHCREMGKCLLLIIQRINSRFKIMPQKVWFPLSALFPTWELRHFPYF